MPLAKRNDCGDAKYAGLEIDFSADPDEVLQVRGVCASDLADDMPGIGGMASDL